MKFCSECGQRVIYGPAPGEDRARFVCRSCGLVHYQNPKVVVGAIVADGPQVLLCRRAIEPRRNLWTVPAGYLENGETLIEGVRREVLEEALARLEGVCPYLIFNITHIGQVYLIYRARLVDHKYGPGSESLEADLFATDAIPWNELAFPVVHDALKLYCRDVANGSYPFRELDVTTRMDDFIKNMHSDLG